MNSFIINPNANLELAARQARYDRLHHLYRLHWLSQENPCYSCGTPVLPSHVHQMITASKNVLEMLPMAFNHCDLNDSDYVARLDEFALENNL